MAKRIIYHPPPKKVVEDFAEQVCQRLAEMHDASYAKPAVVSGLARFLQLAGTILAKHLSSKDETEEKLDTDDN